MDLKGKKLLIIGGAFQHCKIVEAAHEMGVITYVVDYLPVEKAPAKQISDYHFEYNITDYDEIVELCKTEHIDGVLSSHLDACQIPYQEICERMGFPCFGNKEQFRILTDKTAFLKKCTECGVDIIPQYSESDFESEETCKAEFPVFIKPCDSRGSRGQTICFSFDEVRDAVSFAKSESKTGKVIIEKFMGGKQDFTLSYLVKDGKVHLVRSGDRYVGRHEDKMDKSSICSISPSDNLDLYFNNCHEKMEKMIESIGIKNGPVFVQGFIDGDKIRMYDPGLRFPGCEYDRMYKDCTGIDLCKKLVNFALTGEIELSENELDEKALLNSKKTAMLFLVLKPGKIKSITGTDALIKNKKIISFAQKAFVGDEIGEFYNVNQRLGEVDIIADGADDLCNVINWVYDTVHVYDTDGNEMIFAKFDEKYQSLIRE